jgi:copper(I)-binding protein
MILLAGCIPQAITISDAWARPGIQGGSSAVYFTIDNGTGSDDALTGVETDAAERSEMHQSQMDANGTMSMLPQESVPLPAGEPVTFAPGGLHVMLTGLTRDLVPGDTVVLHLTFQTAEALDLKATVREP